MEPTITDNPQHLRDSHDLRDLRDHDRDLRDRDLQDRDLHDRDLHDRDLPDRDLRDRLEIADALYRFGLGQDTQDTELFASAWTHDAELDFRPAAAKWGGNPPLMIGRDTIVTTILTAFAGRVDTTHQVTNVRATIDGDTAQATALVEAQHLLTADHSTHALLKNPYTVELVRDGPRWLIRRMRIENTWFTGDPAAIFGG